MATSQLQKTFSGASNRKTFTFSYWVKRGRISTGMYFAHVGNQEANPQAGIEFNATHDRIEFWNGGSGGGGSSFAMSTNRKFRDTSAWYHIVIAVDTTQSTEADRVKIYVNNEQITSFSSATYPSQNDDLEWNSTQRHTIGAYYNNQSYFSGLVTHFHFTDGTAYTPSTFGETDSTSGIWKPKASPTGISYGTNGFFLKFENSSALGTDSSGNSNTFTVVGTPTQNVDTPSNNFATLNPLHSTGNSTLPALSNGNLTYTGHSSTNYSGTYSSMAASSGKWYAEFKCTGGAGAVDMMIGAGTGITNTTAPGASTNDMVVFGYDGKYYAGGSGVSWGGDSWVSGDIIGVAMDLDNNKLYVSKNGTWMNSGDPTSGSTGTGALTLAASTITEVYHFLLGDYGGSGTPICESNFGSGYFGTTQVASANADANGHGAFEYAVPSGYYSLNTKNLKEFG